MRKITLYFKLLLVFFCTASCCNMVVAYDSEKQAKEIKDYQQRIYSQKDLIQKLDNEVSTLNIKLKNEITQNQNLTTQVNTQKEQIANLREQILQLSTVQQTLQQNHQSQSTQFQQQTMACQQNQQQCLRQLQNLTQQLQTLTSICKK